MQKPFLPIISETDRGIGEYLESQFVGRQISSLISIDENRIYFVTLIYSQFVFIVKYTRLSLSIFSLGKNPFPRRG